MSKKPRLWEPKPHRAVNFNAKAIEKCIARDGCVYSEPKYDGIRCLLVHLNGRWVATSREGIEITALTDILGYMQVRLQTHKSKVFDCEVFIDGLSFEESSGILRRDEAVQAPYACQVRFALLDVAYVDGKTGHLFNTLSYRERTFDMIELEGRLSSNFVYPSEYRRRCNSLDEVMERYEYFRKHGFEGAVVKAANLSYRNGKVTGWFKQKPDITVGGVVTGFRYGDLGKSNEGLVVGFQVALEDGTACTATGFSQALMHEVTDNLEGFYGRAVEVAAMERTASGNLRHPVFKRFRDLEGSEGLEA